MATITKNTTDLKIGTLLRAIKVEDNAPFELGKFYKITDGDCVGSYIIGNNNKHGYSINEIGDYFELIQNINDIDELATKMFTIKETFEQTKIMSNNNEYFFSDHSILEEAMSFLMEDEVFKGDVLELQFICENIDITMVERCSCCGIIIMPNDECYGDSLNDDKPLCQNCSVYNEQSEMYEKYANQNVIEEFNEIDIVKDDILHNLFCLEDEIIVPTYAELVNAKEILPQWRLCEKYEHASYDSILYEVQEQCENFFYALESLNSAKEKEKGKKTYNTRTVVEFGTSIEIVSELQELHNIYANGELDLTKELIMLQDSRSTIDYASIEIVLQCNVKFEELSTHLKSALSLEHHDEIDMLIECIKEAQADKHETLHLYDC